MDDQTFLNQLAEKLSKLGTVRPLGFHYLHPYGTVPADSIICNGATYSRALYKDFFDYITTQGWVKTEAEWQEIATRDNGFCPFYSSGDGSTNFRTPKFAPYQQVTMEVAQATTYPEAGLPNITGRVYDKSGNNSPAWTIDPEITEASGAFRIGADAGYTGGGTSKSKLYVKDFNFDASRSNTIYGNSDTVQPESHEWVMCVVAYGVATNVGSVDIQNVMSALQAENGMLKAENYSDKNAKEVYAQSLADNRRLRDEAFAYLKPLADESANNRVELAKLQAELKCFCEKQELREQIVLGKVNELALTTQAKFGCLDQTIAGMMGTIGKITDTIVPMSTICPTPMAKYNAWVAPTNTPATGA